MSEFFTHILLLCVLFLNSYILHEVKVNICQLHFHNPCNCFGKCKCRYYILLMTMPSCKSILISCGCIPSFNFLFLYFCSEALWLVLLKKIMMLCYSSNISIFHKYEDYHVLFQEISWTYILSHLIAWAQLLLLLLL